MTSAQALDATREAHDLLIALDDRLRSEIRRFQDAGKDARDPFRGLYISDADAIELADAGDPLERGAWIPLVARRAAVLAERFQLTGVETAALLLGAAPDLDLRYERVFAYLQDNVSCKRPSVDLVLRLLCARPQERRLLRVALASTGRLARCGLIELRNERQDQTASLLASAVHVDERITSYLLGSDDIDDRLAHLLVREVVSDEPGDPPSGIRDAVDAIARRWIATRTGTLAALTGLPGSGKRAAARRVASQAGGVLLTIDTASLLRSELPATTIACLIFREAVLQDAPMYVRDASLLFEEGDASAKLLAAILERLEKWNGIALFGGPPRWGPPGVLARRPVVQVEVPAPSALERSGLWRAALGEDDAARLRPWLPVIAAGFRLSPGRIRDAVHVARERAAVRSADPRAFDVEDLFAASRAVSGRALGAVAEEIRSTAAWGDIVLPADVVAQLREVCATAHGRGTVLEKWGFGRKVAGGTGITALFAGPSGTGKTMAAGIVARDLGLPIFRVDLARVVSKWIGETEKNLERIFRAAEDSNAVLLLDEADALFGKRSEVKDSHDRYANIEISYLLQRMERYDGVAILTTNMPQSIDEAFVRRLSFTVYFPLPAEAERARIWETTWPSEAPRAADVDLRRLARFKLTGGNIRNVLLAAAYLAADDGSAITGAHLRRGLQREYQKLGKDLTPAELD